MSIKPAEAEIEERLSELLDVCIEFLATKPPMTDHTKHMLALVLKIGDLQDELDALGED